MRRIPTVATLSVTMPVRASFPRLLAVSVSALHILAGCTTVDGPTSPATTPPSRLISDGAHSGNPHFFFLPPLVSPPSPAGVFDPAVAPTVEICALSGPACGATIATYTMTSGPGGEVIKLNAGESHYHVNWETGDFSLSDVVNYRIKVSVGQTLLGLADVDVAKRGSEFKNLSTGELIGLVDGRTLPIKFRIEAGIVGAVVVDPSTAYLEVGDNLSFQATVLDLHGVPLAEPVTWSSSHPAVAAIGPTGLSSGLSAGLTLIIATAQGIAGKATLEVFPASLIAWTRGDDIYVMSGLGNNPSPLTSTGSAAQADWSPDGAKLAFLRFGDVTSNNIWSMNADGTGQTQLTSGPDLDAFPAWSPTGGRIAFSRNFFSGGTELMTVTPDGATLGQVTTGGGFLGHWSPDGTSIAFSRFISSSEADVYVVKADGTGLTNLSADATSFDMSAQWSPDGSKLVFSRQLSPGAPDLYLMNPDGSGKTNLTAGLGITGREPSWSPDGSKILFVHLNDLYLISTNGANLVQLTDSPMVEDEEAVWSPDGGRIAFVQRSIPDDGQGDIYIVKADGSKLWQLTDSPSIDDHDPAWRP